MNLTRIKVTYNLEEYLILNCYFELEVREEIEKEVATEYAMASSLGVIWLSKPSVKYLLHELLHIIGWKLGIPMFWHKLIHKVL